MRHSRLTAREAESLIENLSTLLSSGMPPAAALAAIALEVPSKRAREAISAMQGDLEAGVPMWRTIESVDVAPAHIISLIRVGERTGRLSAHLALAAAQQQRERFFRAQVRSAMTYPLLVFSLAIVIGLGISWYILPRLARVFLALQVPLPALTRGVIAIGVFLQRYGIIAVPATLAGLALVTYVLFIGRRTKHFGQALLFHIPPIRAFMQEIELGRFGHLLGTLLEAGVPLNEALVALENGTGHRAYLRLYAHLGRSLDEGKGFRRAFAEYRGAQRIFPASVQQTIVHGEQSGHLREALIGIGVTYGKKTEISSKNLAVLIEPFLLILVWLAVAALTFAVILPIYRLIGSLQ